MLRYTVGTLWGRREWCLGLLLGKDSGEAETQVWSRRKKDQGEKALRAEEPRHVSWGVHCKSCPVTCVVVSVVSVTEKDRLAPCRDEGRGYACVNNKADQVQRQAGVWSVHGPSTWR